MAFRAEGVVAGLRGEGCRDEDWSYGLVLVNRHEKMRLWAQGSRRLSRSGVCAMAMNQPERPEPHCLCLQSLGP